jgi:hypothetical protein
MTDLRRSVGVVGLLASLVASVWLVAQADPHLGTWVLNTARSKYTPGPPPTSQTSVYAVEGNGWKITTRGTAALGLPTSTEFTVSFDGKDHPVRGNPDWDAVSIRRVDRNTVEFTRKRNGKVVQTATSMVSADGKIRTVTATGVNAKGEKVSTVGVYDRR